MQERLLNYRIGRWMRAHGRSSAHPDRATARLRADFARRYGEVCAACALLEPEDGCAQQLASSYMTCVLREENDGRWWSGHAAECTQSWFIWQYCLERGMVSAPVPIQADVRARVIRPAAQKYAGCAHIWFERTAKDGRLGLMYCEYAYANGEFIAFMRRHDMRMQSGRFVRKVHEWSAPVLERAAEMAVQLLDRGCAVSVDGPELERAILEECFTPEHRYWVLASKQADILRLNYPRDQRLHGYVCRAGGHWNGHYMAISICHADRIEELIRLYGFRCTDEARRRLNAWHEAEERATVFRPRRGCKRPEPDTPADMFRAILVRSVEVIPELLDENE